MEETQLSTDDSNELERRSYNSRAVRQARRLQQQQEQQEDTTRLDKQYPPVSQDLTMPRVRNPEVTQIQRMKPPVPSQGQHMRNPSVTQDQQIQRVRNPSFTQQESRVNIQGPSQDQRVKPPTDSDVKQFERPRTRSQLQQAPRESQPSQHVPLPIPTPKSSRVQPSTTTQSAVVNAQNARLGLVSTGHPSTVNAQQPSANVPLSRETIGKPVAVHIQSSSANSRTRIQNIVTRTKSQHVPPTPPTPRSRVAPVEVVNPKPSRASRPAPIPASVPSRSSRVSQPAPIPAHVPSRSSRVSQPAPIPASVPSRTSRVSQPVAIPAFIPSRTSQHARIHTPNDEPTPSRASHAPSRVSQPMYIPPPVPTPRPKNRQSFNHPSLPTTPRPQLDTHRNTSTNQRRNTSTPDTRNTSIPDQRRDASTNQRRDTTTAPRHIPTPRPSTASSLLTNFVPSRYNYSPNATPSNRRHSLWLGLQDHSFEHVRQVMQRLIEKYADTPDLVEILQDDMEWLDGYNAHNQTRHSNQERRESSKQKLIERMESAHSRHRSSSHGRRR